jgi:hypothetical protein
MDVVLDGRGLLCLREFRFPTYITHQQIKTLLILAIPLLQRILDGVTQLMDGRVYAFARLDVELNCLDSVFVGVHV